VTFSDDPDQQCHHTAEVVVDAPADAAYSLWGDWTKLLDFLDLVGQVCVCLWLCAAVCRACIGLK
jgi:uncharacterized membrane protein